MSKLSLFLRIILMGMAATFLTGCDDEWLDVKRDRQLIVPSTLKDLRMLLADELVMTTDYISLMQLSTDEYYLEDQRYNALTTILERNAYIWKDDIYESQESISDWDNSYNQVLTANVVLERVAHIERDERNLAEWDYVMGSALYFRGKAFFNLARTFANVYDPLSALSDPGIPMRTDSDVNLSNVRASLEETYRGIIADLKQAAQKLPSEVVHKTDPSKGGAYGVLARCYLSMNKYEEAEVYADSALSEYDDLMDYNTLNLAASIPFTRFNSETIQFGQISPLYSVFVFLRENFVPDELYQSYDDDDLRKVLFFRHLGGGRYSFKGSYDGGATPFTGIASDELYLIRAECRARSGDVEGAMADINALLVNRYKTGTYVNRVAASVEEAIEIVLLERRKELMGRGLRWSDLKRLNVDPHYAVTLQRTVNGIQHTLEPGDDRYVFSIPKYVVERSGMEQNPR